MKYFITIYALLYLFPIFMVEKCDLLQVVKNWNSKNWLLVTLRPFLLTCKFLTARKWLFFVSVFKREHCNKNISSVNGLKIKFFNFWQRSTFCHFQLFRSTFIVNFVNVQAKRQKIFGNFSGKSHYEHSVKSFASYLQKCARTRIAVLQVDIFRNPWC